MKRRPRSTYDRSYDRSYERDRASYSKPAANKSPFNFDFAKLALMGGILIVGIGIGMAFSLHNTFDPQNVTSTVAIDRSAPNPELCQKYGASAIVTDMRVFVTLNPFKVFVTQPAMQPGCVLRSNNWALLEQQKLVSHKQVVECKNRMNTFGFVNNLESKPDIACIYPNDDAGNLFLNKPGAVEPQVETDRF